MYDESNKTKEDGLKRAKKVLKTSLNGNGGGDKRTDKSIEICGVPIYGTQMIQVLRKVWLQRKEMLHVATVNPEYIMEARRNPKFKSILAQCLTVADGWGVVWASKILDSRRKTPVERVSGVELVREILTHAEAKGEKVFLLGARHLVAERAALAMNQKYPGVSLAWYEGAQTVRLEKSEEASMTIAKINGFEPDYLFVAYGSPYQDLWIEENRPYLRVRVAIGVGGTLDEWAGVVVVCPQWLDAIGLKWVWRVVHEPWRSKRIGRALLFGLLVLYHKLID